MCRSGFNGPVNGRNGPSLETQLAPNEVNFIVDWKIVWPRLELGRALKIAEPKVRTCESMHDEQVQLPSLGAKCTWSMTIRVFSSAPERRSPCIERRRTDRDDQFVIPSNAISYARINAQRFAKLAVTVAGWRSLAELSTANAVQRTSARARDF